MDIRNVAQAALDAGWAVVPLVKGEKRAASSWQKTVYAAADFKDSDGLAFKCGEPSGWRVDVDLDCDEAVEAAKLLLPDTGLIHGRPGKLDSHYWFLIEGAKTAQFTDVKDTSGKSSMLVELRSTGGYTMVPPSFHPSGEQLAWSVSRDPMVMTLEDGKTMVRDVAIVALLARHWPGHGARHAMVGHLAGFLLQAGLTGNRVIRLISVAAAVAKDADVGDRVAFARGTVGKHAAGDKVTGGPKLADDLGADVVAKLRGWLKLKDTDAIEGFNRVHFVVRMGKDTVIGREDDPAGVVFQQPRALTTEYANRKIVVGEDAKGNPKFECIFPHWLEDPKRRSYRAAVFEPPPLIVDPQDYNMWQGFAIEPASGDCSRYLEHVHEVICSKNDEHFVYLMNLLAQMVQEPGTPSGIATVLRGGQGTGKGAFMRPLMEIFGRRHAIQLDKTDQVTGHFNSGISSRVLVFADEAFWAGDKREIGALKRLITEDTLAIERKGIDVCTETNHVHIFLATNNDWAWPAEVDDRRGFLLKVADHRVADTAYFGKLFQELRHGGTAALLATLLAWQLDKALLAGPPPKTVELRNQKVKSLGTIETWVHECLHTGQLGSAPWPDGKWMPCADLFKLYADWLSQRRGRLCSHPEFGEKANVYLSAEKSKPRRLAGQVAKCLLLRTLVDARLFFDRGIPGDWPALEDDDDKSSLF